MQRLKKYFITGILVVGPAALTIYLLIVVFRFADNILGQFLNQHLKKIVGFYIPGIGLLMFILIILFAGFLANQFIGKKLFHLLGRWFSGLPIIKNIYPAFDQIIQFILLQKEFGFKKVVLLEYPSKGLWSLGFLTNEQFLSINRACSEDMIAVFVPNTPGPLSGYVVFVPRQTVKFIDMPVSEALKIIISGGVFKSAEHS